MAKTLKTPSDEFRTPCNFDETTDRALTALDFFRVGWLSEGMSRLTGVYFPNCHVDVAHYHDNKKRFKQDMRLLANAFAKYGH